MSTRCTYIDLEAIERLHDLIQLATPSYGRLTDMSYRRRVKVVAHYMSVFREALVGRVCAVHCESRIPPSLRRSAELHRSLARLWGADTIRYEQMLALRLHDCFIALAHDADAEITFESYEERCKVIDHLFILFVCGWAY